MFDSQRRQSSVQYTYRRWWYWVIGITRTGHHTMYLTDKHHNVYRYTSCGVIVGADDTPCIEYAVQSMTDMFVCKSQPGLFVWVCSR